MSLSRVRFDPYKTVAFDSTKPQGGAPAMPGTIMEYLDPDYGLQKFRLVLNQTDGAIVVGNGYAFANTSAAESDALALKIIPTIGAQWAAATLKHNLAGVAVVAAADQYWTWLQVKGRCPSVDANAAIDAGDMVEAADNGEIDDTVGTGQHVGWCYAAISADALGECFLNLVD